MLSLDSIIPLDTAFRSLSSVVSSMGFDSIVYTLIPLSLRTDLPPVFLKSRDFSNGFLQHYEQAGLVEHDFTIKRAAAGLQTTLNWQKELATSQLTSAEANVVLLAQHDYGINNAITIPAQNTPDTVAGFSITSCLKTPLFDDLHCKYADLLRLLCEHFHRFVVQLHRRPFYKPIIDSLSDHEKSVIDLVSNGYRLKQSFDLYSLSPGLAGKTLHKLYRKFGVSDQGELGHLIGRHQLVEMLDIDTR